MSTLDDWIAAACAELGIERNVAADQRELLDMAREVAHQVDRPAAPLTAFLLGVGVGEGRPLQPMVDRLLALAGGWQRPTGEARP